MTSSTFAAFAALALAAPTSAPAQACPAGRTCFYVPPTDKVAFACAPTTVLYLGSPTAATTYAAAYSAGTPAAFSGSLATGDLLRFDLGTSANTVSNWSVVERRGLLVSSPATDLLVEQREEAGCWQQGATLKPHWVGLGTRFRVAGYNLSQDSGTDDVGYDWVSVYAPTGATVTFTAPPGAPATFWNGYSGTTQEVTLAAGQTYLLRTAGTVEVDGALVTATAPIAVDVGGRGWGPLTPGGGIACGDDGSDAVVDVAYWGTTFVVAPYPASLYDTRVVADQDGTVVKVNGATVATLAAGGTYRAAQFPTSVALIEASKPVGVFQNAGQVSCETDLAFIPPIAFADVGRSTYGFNIPSGFTATVVAIAPASTVAGGVLLDGSAASPTISSPPGRADLSVARLTVAAAGNHTLSLSNDFQLGVVTGRNGVTGMFSYYSPYRIGGCGDGALSGSEQCDDGNVAPGDGCSPICTVEPGWDCGPSGNACQCATDAACAAGSFCSDATTPRACAPQLADGAAIPASHGVCGGAAGAQGAPAGACASGGCNPVTNTCAAANSAACGTPAQCVANVCAGDGHCGHPDGEGPCTGGDACRSGVCAASGVCVPAASGACWADSDCAPSQFCRRDTYTCTADLAAGVALPADGLHDGNCTTTLAAAVCTSGLCNPVRSTCAVAAGSACTARAECVNDSCGATGTCGLPDGQPGCTVPTAASVCVSATCSPNAGVCIPAGPGTCWVDADCAGGAFCRRDTYACTAKLADGSGLPSDGLHTGACSGPEAAAVCASGRCNATTLTCGAANGAACSGAAGCASNVCNPAAICGWRNGEGPCSVASPGVCQSGACSPGGNACVPAASGACWVDADCGAAEFCRRDTFTCTAKLADGVALPADGLHGACAGASAACASGKCNASALTCASDNGAACTAAAQCVSGACGANGRCGLAVGEAGCTAGTAAALCQSGACSVANACMPAAGCWADGDCAASQYCDRAARTCAADLAYGEPLPSDGLHDGLCTPALAALACQTGECNPATNTCSRPNQLACASDAQCTSGRCGANGLCGLAGGQAGCTAQTAAAICQSGTCSVGGACIPAGGCFVDADCVVASHCDRGALACAPDLANGAAIPSDGLHDGTCTAATAAAVCRSGACNAAAGTCAAPNGTACTAAAQCVAEVCGANGVCGLADGQAGCTAATAARCQSGACSGGGACIPVGGCFVDADCAVGWCNRATLACAARLAPGAALPTDPIHQAQCTPAVAGAVCTTGLCNAAQGTCGDANSTACTGGAECASNVCSADGACGKPGNAGCTADAECRSGRCVAARCTAPEAYPAGRGFGCGAPGAGSLGALGLLAAGLLAMRRPRQRRAVVAAALLCAAASVPAGETGFALERYQPAAPGGRFLRAESLSFAGPGDGAAALAVRLDAALAGDPLVVRTRGGIVERAVSRQSTGTLALAYSPGERWRIHAALPMQLSAAGTAANAGDRVVGAPNASAALGDVGLGITARLLGDADAGVRLGAVAAVTFPTGAAASYSGDGTAAGSLGVVAAGDLGSLGWSATAGGRYRRDGGAKFAGVDVGPEAFVTPALGWRPQGTRWTFSLEAPVAATLGAPDPAAKSALYLEPMLGVQRALGGHWLLLGGAGAGVTSALGTPSWRGVLALQWVGAARAARRAAAPDGTAAESPPPSPSAPPAPPAAPPVPSHETSSEIGAPAPPAPPAPATPAAPPIPRPTATSAEVVALAPPAPPPPAPGPEVRVAKERLELGQVVEFEAGSDAIRPEGERLLRSVADLLAAHGEIVRLRVEGHTDATGRRADNLALSARRAEAVRRWLVERGGVDAGRLSAQGFGPTRPIAPNDTAAGRSKNRRIELVIVERR